MRYQIGQTVISKKPEIDCDDDDNERVTPAGSHWEIMREDDGSFSIECRATGGWLFVTADELQRDFSVAPSLEEQLKAAIERETALAANNERLRGVLNACNEYIYGSHLNTIAHGSKVHLEIARVLEETPIASLALRDAETISSLSFPTMLRKMWSGGEVQQWLDEQAADKRA